MTLTETQRMTLPGWLIELLTTGDRGRAVNAELNCARQDFRALLAERRLELGSEEAARTGNRAVGAGPKAADSCYAGGVGAEKEGDTA